MSGLSSCLILRHFPLSLLILQSHFAQISTLASSYTTFQDRVLTELKTVVDNSSAYSKGVRPRSSQDANGWDGDSPTQVNVSLFIGKIQKIDDIKMELTLRLYFRQGWKDERLKYGIEDVPLDKRADTYVHLDPSMFELIWNPDLFFDNEVSSLTQGVSSPNVLKRVYPDGHVLMSTRLTLVQSCPMDLQNFPFDRQVCTVRLMSWSHSLNDLAINWNETRPVSFYDLNDYRYARFEFIKHEMGNCEDLFSHGGRKQNESKSPLGMFSCIHLNLHFKRHSSAYVVQIMIPAFMLVLLSWITFWLGESISARLSLTLTVLLTMTTVTHGITQSLPMVSYTRAIDVWTGLCLSFLMAAVVETAVVGHSVMKRRDDPHQHSEKKGIQSGQRSNNGAVVHPTDEKGTARNLKSSRTCCNPNVFILDKMCRFLFPLVFVSFTIVYAVVYAFKH